MRIDSEKDDSKDIAVRVATRGGKHLGAGALAHRDNAVLVGVEHLAHLPHGLRVGRAGREVARPVKTAE